MKIYYAHHQWKYGTKIEEYELDLIKTYFCNADIFNPSTDMNVTGKTEEEIMGICLEQVNKSDIVVFSSVDGVIGKGVYTELEQAEFIGTPILYISNGYLIPSEDIIIRRSFGPRSYDRVYGYVMVKGVK